QNSSGPEIKLAFNDQSFVSHKSVHGRIVVSKVRSIIWTLIPIAWRQSKPSTQRMIGLEDFSRELQWHDRTTPLQKICGDPFLIHPSVDEGVRAGTHYGAQVIIPKRCRCVDL